MPKHYRPPGKKKEGNAARYITRTKAIRHLQINLSTFRRLCILKGVFPRDPRKKTEGKHKTYYHAKDISFLAHEPLLGKFRDIRAHEKKVKKAFTKKNDDLALRLLSRKPSYKLDRLIKERYPTFIDALRDLDDCLTMVHLFAALPASHSERIEAKRIHNCRRLSHEWQAYISRTHSLRKTFISVKGIYYQAELEGQRITWLTPHSFQQVLTDDVDYKVMLTFLEFYETLLAFVNFKLYHSLNVKYPPILDPHLEALAAELYALSRFISAAPKAHLGTQQNEEKKEHGESELRLAQLQKQLPANEAGALMNLIGEAVHGTVEEEDKNTKECKSLFKQLNFFLSREVPREPLLFVISAFGGTVSWEGGGSPFSESDESITHQIVDRPSQGHIFLSREYVQPQWIYDCVNARLILPTEKYIVGRVPPPHLSPFIDNDAEGYVPEYAETIRRLQAASEKQPLPMTVMDTQEIDEGQRFLDERIIDRTEANVAAEKKQKEWCLFYSGMFELEKQFHDELEKELKGITYSVSLLDKKAIISDEPAAETKVDALRHGDHIQEDECNMSKVMMSREKRKLYEAMQIGKKRKSDEVNILKERKRRLEWNGQKICK